MSGRISLTAEQRGGGGGGGGGGWGGGGGAWVLFSGPDQHSGS